MDCAHSEGEKEEGEGDSFCLPANILRSTLGSYGIKMYEISLEFLQILFKTDKLVSKRFLFSYCFLPYD